MKRFGEFSLFEEFGESDVADCYKANHDAQGGPFFLKRYGRLEPALSPALHQRCQLLMSVAHPNLAPHLGHGDVDGVAFTVSPWLEGIDLDEFISSIRERRAVITLEALLFVVREAALGVHALHTAVANNARPLLAHGDVCSRHIRIGGDGQVWLTGLPTPRGLNPGEPPDAVWDCAGLAATIYDLIPLTRQGGKRPPLPPSLDRVVRRSLGIGPPTEQLGAGEFAERLEEVAQTLRLPSLDKPVLADIAARAVDAVLRNAKGRAADALPTLEPVLGDSAGSAGANPATLELEPIDRDLSGEEIATTMPVVGGAQMPAGSAPTPGPQPAVTTLPVNPPPITEPPTASPAVAAPAVAAPPVAAPAVAAPPPAAPPSPAPPSPAPPSPAPPSPAPPSAAPPASAAPVTAPAAAGSVITAPAVNPSPASTPPLAAPPVTTPVATAPPAAAQAAADPSLGPPDQPGPQPPASLKPAPRMPIQPMPQPPGAAAQTPVLAQRAEPANPVSGGPRPVTIANMVLPKEVADALRDQPLEDSAFDQISSAFGDGTDESSAFADAPAGEAGPFSEGTAETETPFDDATPAAGADFADSTEVNQVSQFAVHAVATTAPLAEADPFSEQTLPGHLVESIPSEDPKEAVGQFADELTRPDASALAPSDRPTDPSATVPRRPPPAAPAGDQGPFGHLDELPRTRPAGGGFSLLADPVEETKPHAAAPPQPATPAHKPKSNLQPAMQALLDRDLVPAEKLLEAREQQRKDGGRVSEILVSMGVITDDEVADALAEAAGKPRMSDDALAARTNAELCRRLPQTYSLGRRALPLALVDDTVTLAVADPFDEAGAAEMCSLLGAAKAELHVVSRGVLTKITRRTYRALGVSLDVPGAADDSPFILLVMTDEAEVLKFGARLTEEGFHVEHAADVLTANRLLKVRPPTAFVIAMETPEAETFLLSVRGLSDYEDAPLFAVGDVDDDDEDTVEAVLEMGADDFFERPLRVGPVIAKMRRSLAKRGITPKKPEAPATPKVRAPPPPTGEAPGHTPPKGKALAGPPPPSAEEWARTATAKRVHELGALPSLPTDNPAAAQVAQPTGVMGTLTQMGVPEIVQSLEMGRKTATVELVPTGAERGAIGLTEGQVVFAECGDLLGEEAFYALASHANGFFRIRYGEGPKTTNIEGSTTFLLLEAMRRMDEGVPAADGLNPPTPVD